jgi:hypothetical protein
LEEPVRVVAPDWLSLPVTVAWDLQQQEFLKVALEDQKEEELFEPLL